MSALLKKIEEALQQSGLIAEWSGIPAFPWKEAGRRLSDLLQVKQCKLSAEKSVFQESGKLLDALGDHPFLSSLAVTPLEGICHLAIPQEDMTKMASYLLTKDHSFKGFSDRALREGFYTFTLLQILHLFEEWCPFGQLSPRLVDAPPLPQEGAFCMDISLAINSVKVWGRLIYPKEFHEACLAYFKQHKPPLVTQEMAEQLELSLSLEAGSTLMKPEEWEQAKAGDFIVLDRCGFDLEAKRGSGYLTLHTTPLFQVRIKEGEIKVAEAAATEKGAKGMVKVAVEMSRFPMKLETLLQLKAGQILDYPLDVQQTVDLTIQGEKAAAGELIKLGELLGVRLL
jgi:type III secretion system YscQ/HrcQ family protein